MKGFLYVLIIISGLSAAACNLQSKKEREDANKKDSTQVNSLRNSTLNQAGQLLDSVSSKDSTAGTKDSLKKQSK